MDGYSNRVEPIPRFSLCIDRSKENDEKTQSRLCLMVYQNLYPGGYKTSLFSVFVLRNAPFSHQSLRVALVHDRPDSVAADDTSIGESDTCRPLLSQSLF